MPHHPQLNNTIIAFICAFVVTTVTCAMVMATVVDDATMSWPAGLRRGGVSPTSFIEDANFTGSAAVQQPHKFKWHKNFGYLDLRFRVPMPAEPSYMVGSNTKLFVAIAMYQLQERGKVKLHDNIADYITAEDMKSFGQVNQTRYCPKVAGNSSCQAITFVNLMEMSAGIAGSEAMFLPNPGTMAGVVGLTCFNADLLFVPSTQYYYSNPSWQFAAWFVEKFSGMELDLYLKKNIFEPLRLENTYYDPYNGKFALNQNQVVEYYQYIENSSRSNLLRNGQVSSEIEMGTAAGAGGIISTLADEATLYYALFSNFSKGAKNPLLSYHSLIEIVKPRMRVKNDPWQPNMWYAQGLGVLTQTSSKASSSASSSAVLPPTTPQVTTIFYMGGTIATHTANVMDVRYSPPVLGQAFSNVQVYYPTTQQWLEAQAKKVGSFFDIVADWNQVSRHETLNIALKLISMFAG